MAQDPLRKSSGRGRPEIWASGGQRPPFNLRALGSASLHLSREGVAPVLAWAARGLRRGALKIKAGTGRIPAEKLGRAERFVPSHLRVAGWIANLATTLAHGSATADPEVPRGNALVAEIQPYLWAAVAAAPEPAPALESAPPPGEVAPVVLAEPVVLQPGDDPLASIRDEIGAEPDAPRPKAPDQPPAPPGPRAEGTMQVAGYMAGWASVILVLPLGLVWALWLWLKGRDLRQIGTED
jgi:hypothetical protein